MAILSSGGIALPSPVSIQIDDEIIWSSDSERDLSGLFSGDVVAQKKAIVISWGVLTEAELRLIKSKLCAGYFPLSFRDVDGMTTIESYRGTLSSVLLGTFSEVAYYKSASCKIIQR